MVDTVSEMVLWHACQLTSPVCCACDAIRDESLKASRLMAWLCLNKQCEPAFALLELL